MSKNFELMQQAGLDQSLRPVRPVRAPEVPFSPLRPADNRHRNGHKTRTHLDIEQFAREESLRLVQRIFLLQTQTPPRAVVFAGIDHGNGCSEICVSVAQTLANNVRGSICLLEANLRSPALPALFGTTNHYGLTDALLQEGPIRSFAKPLRGDNLWLISSGSLAPDSPKLLNSDRLKTRFTELRKEFDYVLIDAPPLTRYADAVGFGQITDGFVLILEANVTRREAALRVSENLRASGIHVLGAVLNKRTFPIPESLYHKL
jgi:capsular exopolysaccharide synthesis family protein